MPEKMLEHLREFSSVCADLPIFHWRERSVRPLRVTGVAGAALGTFTIASRLLCPALATAAVAPVLAEAGIVERGNHG